MPLQSAHECIKWISLKRRLSKKLVLLSFSVHVSGKLAIFAGGLEQGDDGWSLRCGLILPKENDWQLAYLLLQVAVLWHFSLNIKRSTIKHSSTMQYNPWAVCALSDAWPFVTPVAQPRSHLPAPQHLRRTGRIWKCILVAETPANIANSHKLGWK